MVMVWMSPLRFYNKYGLEIENKMRGLQWWKNTWRSEWARAMYTGSEIRVISSIHHAPVTWVALKFNMASKLVHLGERNIAYFMCHFPFFCVCALQTWGDTSKKFRGENRRRSWDFASTGLKTHFTSRRRKQWNNPMNSWNKFISKNAMTPIFFVPTQLPNKLHSL